MNKGFDKLDDEIAEGAHSPVSGISSALGAGEALSAAEILTPAMRKRAVIELPAYLLVQVAWFAAFGMQMVIFPYLLKNVLNVSGTALGLAQMALALPSVVFILLGGVLAERADGRNLLILFHLLAALPAAALGIALERENLTYWMMVIYAVGMGTIGAFMMPARDAILNEVVERRRRAGSSVTLQQGVAFATLAQFAAQILGLWIGGMASAGGVWPLLGVQAGIVASGAIAALFLARVLSIYQLGFMGGAPIGAAVMGIVADHAGPRLVILVPSIGMLTMIAAMALFTPIWKLQMKRAGE